MEIIEINGTLYKRNEYKQKKAMSSKMMGLLLAGMALNGNMYKSTKEPELHIDLIEEFKLIQAKKSKLTRKQRDWVTHQFHKHYTKS